MAEIYPARDLIIGLLSMGGAPDITRLFDLIVMEAPRLVGAEECSIFWKDGRWRDAYRRVHGKEMPDAIYRRATYEQKKHLLGIDYYEPGEGLTGWVAKNGKSLRLDDITDRDALKKIDPQLYNADKQHGYRDSKSQSRQRAFLAVPIIIDDETCGVIRIAKTLKPKGNFTAGSQELLETFANHIGTVIKRADDEELKKLWEEMYLSGISFQSAQFDSYLERVATDVPRYLDARGCSIFLIEQNGAHRFLRLRATTADGPLHSEIGRAVYEIGEGLTGWVAQENSVLRVRNVDDADELHKIDPKLEHRGKHKEWVYENSSFLAVPIERGGTVLGVMRVAQDSRKKRFSPTDERLAQYFCRNLAVLVENVRLFESLEVDRNTALRSLADTQAKLGELSGSIIKNLDTIRDRLQGITPGDAPMRCFKFRGKCVKGAIKSEGVAFVGVPFSATYKNLYQHAIRQAVAGVGLTPWIAFEEKSVGDIMCKVCAAIQRSKIGIIDVSEWNANVLFELGLLYGMGRPVILLKQDDARIPVDLAGLEYISYGEFEDLEKELKTHMCRFA